MFRSLHELSAAYRRGETTPSAVTEEHLAGIDRLDGQVGAYLTVMREGEKTEELHFGAGFRRPTTLTVNGTALVSCPRRINAG